MNRRLKFLNVALAALTCTALLAVGCGNNNENNNENDSGGDDTQIAEPRDPVYREEEYLTFGCYPQSVVSDETILAALDGLTVDADGYYSYENNRYVKIEVENAFVESTNGKSGVYSDGTLTTDESIRFFKVEPIEWRVLDEIDGNKYLVTKYALDAGVFYSGASNRTIGGKTVYPNNWEYSDLRAWLNNEFYNTAFNIEDKTLIAETTLDNSAATTNKSSNRYACNNTKDYCFAFSYDEMARIYFHSDVERYCFPTDYALAKGAFYSTTDETAAYYGNTTLWTRSPDASTLSAACSSGSHGDPKTNPVAFKNNAIRPAIMYKG